MGVAIILIGVSGCGKTTVGNKLSEILEWPFYDGDVYHPQANIDKMARGIPLDDTDRQPWLEILNKLILEHLNTNRSLILASSALKTKYRQTLMGDRDEVIFVHLKGDFDLIYGRMRRRKGHFMGAEMLRSQFLDFEDPEDALVISIDKPIGQIAAEIINSPKLHGENLC